MNALFRMHKVPLWMRDVTGWPCHWHAMTCIIRLGLDERSWCYKCQHCNAATLSAPRNTLNTSPYAVHSMHMREGCLAREP